MFLKERLLDLGESRRKNLFQKTESYAKKKNMQIDGKDVPFIHIPYLMPKELTKDPLIQTQKVIDALVKIEEYALRSEGSVVYDRLMNSLTTGGKDLVSQCPYESSFSLRNRHRRVDALLDQKTGKMQLIEINQAAPLALHFHDTCQEIASMVLTELDVPHETKSIYPRLLDWFIAEFQERHPGHFPRVIALPIEHGYPPKFSDLPGMAYRLEKYAQVRFHEELKVIVCFPYEISLKSGTPYVQGQPIDIIWRNSVYMKQYREEGKPIDEYLWILQHPEDYLILNSTRSWLTRTKETFSLFWDDRLMAQVGFTKEEDIESIRSLIPETYNLQYLERHHATLQKIKEEKDLWITKPTDAGFGQGVEFGINKTRDEWQKLMEERSQGGFVFQKKIPYPRERVLDLNSDGELIELDIEFDFCPHHIKGSFAGSALSRANLIPDSFVNQKAMKMNLVSGGLILPLIFI